MGRRKPPPPPGMRAPTLPAVDELHAEPAQPAPVPVAAAPRVDEGVPPPAAPSPAASLDGSAVDSTPVSVKSSSRTPQQSFSTPQLSQAPLDQSSVLRTPDWTKVLKQQGLVSATLTESTRRSLKESQATNDAADAAASMNYSVAEEDETSESEEEDPELAKEFEDAKKALQQQTGQKVSLSPAQKQEIKDGRLCKIEVMWNTKLGKFDRKAQGKLNAQMISAGTDFRFAQRVIEAVRAIRCASCSRYASLSFLAHAFVSVRFILWAW